MKKCGFRGDAARFLCACGTACYYGARMKLRGVSARGGKGLKNLKGPYRSWIRLGHIFRGLGVCHFVSVLSLRPELITLDQP